VVYCDGDTPFYARRGGRDASVFLSQIPKDVKEEAMEDGKKAARIRYYIEREARFWADPLQ